MNREIDLNLLKRNIAHKYPDYKDIVNKVEYQIADKNSKIETLAHKNNKVYINEEFMKGYSEEEQMFFLVHQGLMVEFGYYTQIKNKDPMLWNVATNIIVNNLLEKDGFTLPDGAIKFKNENNLTAEELYNDFKSKNYTSQDINKIFAAKKKMHEQILSL